jgi:hypothetical protein
MSAAFSGMFNDTLTLGISFKVPVWIQKVLGLDVSAQGFSAGFALSYPRFSGGKLDFEEAITFCALCAHVLAWLLTPAASYAPDQLAP